MNEIFKDKEFWLLYKQLENTDIIENEINSYVELLKQDFEIEETECEDGKIIKSVEFVFDCGHNNYLLLDMTFYEDYIDKFIYLGDKSLQEEFLLGWLDLARWHPFCIKLDELELLTRYWQKVESKWEDDIPFLLLNDFVGITEQQEGDKLREREKQILEKLKVYNKKLVSSIYPDGKTREQNLLSDKYQWIMDTESGWIFTSDEYCCYSLRNKEHIGSNCGTFPFKQWNEMIEEIRKQLE